MSRLLKSEVIIFLAVLWLAAATACGSGEDVTATEEPTPTSQVSEETAVPSEPEPSIETLTIIIPTSDLAVGPNRLAFLILDRDNDPFRADTVNTKFVYLGNDSGQVDSEETAVYRPWPTGPGGLFVVNAVLDREGPWGLLAEVVREDGSTDLAQSGFVVMLESFSPALGSAVPASRNRTLLDEPDIGKLTSSEEPDLDLYQMTIEDAISAGKPLVVTFATPAFCASATCGPQVDVVSLVRAKHEDVANFIHIEVFENPDEIGDGTTEARINPLMEEWGLVVEPFTFLLDGDGILRAKFEGFVGEEELEEALVSLLEP